MAEQVNDLQERLAILRQLIREDEASTQQALCKSLRQKKFNVTQSTVSRDLRRIGAIKTTNDDGVVIYKLPQDHRPSSSPLGQDLSGLIIEIQANESTIVLHTTPGSASLVAARLDSLRTKLGILGTISGDDAIFVAPVSVKKISNVIKKIKEEF